MTTIIKLEEKKGEEMKRDEKRREENVIEADAPLNPKQFESNRIEQREQRERERVQADGLRCLEINGSKSQFNVNFRSMKGDAKLRNY